jgi:hypothetical protein
MVPMMAIGQAAGLAAGMCAKSGKKTRDIDIKELQRELLAQNAVLRFTAGI